MIQNNLSLRIKPIRCLLFDLGYTLWDRRKHSHLWYRAEPEANQRALSALRTYFGANRLPSGTDEVLGERLRELFDTHEHDLIRRFPGQEPDRIQILLQQLPALAIHDATPKLGASLRTDILGAQQLGIFTVWQPRPQQRLTIQRYEASQRDMENPEQAGSASPEELSLLQDSVPNTQEGFGADYLPANTQGRDGYLERYLRGEITPDLIIERPSDLLSTFVKAIEE